MIFITHKAPGDGERVLLVMLPGAGIEAGAFAENGMVAAVQAHGAAIDVIAARPELDLYLDGGVVAALDDVIGPAKLYKRIWLLGISLGGMGALLYASAHEDRVAGIFLLAPFLGTKGTIAEVAKAGGLAAWREENSAATEAEKRMLVWLRGLREHPESPAVYLGYGRGDRFAPGHRLLADELPAERVVTAPGGHDWETWLTLWQGLLATRPFAGG